MQGEMRGIIYKLTGGFYYVKCESGEELTCRARGLFRLDGVSPLVGDFVTVSRGEEKTGTVTQVLPRKNSIVRPPLANLDQMVVVLSVVDPVPNFFVVDKLLALLEKQGIEPVIAVTKSDLEDPSPLEDLYTAAGFPVFVVSGHTGEGIAPLYDLLGGKITGFSGNSGVGKSSLLNALDSDFAISVGETSKKLGRGKHTTRHVELFRLKNEGLVADTPGFSSITIGEMGGLDKEELADCFREFRPFLGACKFVNCAHVKEKGCAVLAALAEGNIDPRRHQSYVQLYDEVKDVKPWEHR